MFSTQSYVAAEVLKNKFPDATVRVVARPLEGGQENTRILLLNLRTGSIFSWTYSPGTNNRGVAKLAGSRRDNRCGTIERERRTTTYI